MNETIPNESTANETITNEITTNETISRENAKLGAILIYVLFGLFFIFQSNGQYQGKQLTLYLVLIGAYFWIGGLLVIAKIRYDLYLFEPLTFVALLYLGIFVYKPIIDLRTNAFFEHGIYVMDGGVKATLIIVLSFTVFYISYYSYHPRIVFGNRFTGRTAERAEPEEDDAEYSNNRIVMLYVSWGITFVLGLVCMLSQGMSLRYIFSLGNVGEKISEGNTALLFLSNFAITSISIWLLIMIHSRNTPAKIIITVLEVLYLLTRNGRWLILVIALSPVVYYYIKRKKRPRISFVVLGGLALLVIFAWMQVNRYRLHLAVGYSGWGSGGFSADVLMRPFESDFNTYRSFYSMVTRIPAVYPYMMGATFAYVFILMIPRALWAGKPDNPIHTLIERSLNSSARQAGTATCNVGELYGNFGVIGCVIGMYIAGWIASRVKRLYYSENENRMALYAILYPLLFQWIARGSFSNNVYTMIFAVLPFIILRKREG